MAKATTSLLDWCVVRLGEDMNWWVDEVSDPIRWDVDGLSIVDPRQVAHLIDLVEPLRDYGFDQEILEAAFIPFRIEREVNDNRVRLKRVKDSLFDSEEKLFGLPDVMDDENGPYADLLDHVTRCRVKMLNGVFHFKGKLTIDEVEEEIREEQSIGFSEGRSLHAFDELCAVLDYVPAGWDLDEEDEAGAEKDEDGEEDPDIDDEDLPDVDDEDEERLSKDESLKWDEDDEDGDGEEKDEEGEEDDEDGDDDDEEEERPAKKASKAASKVAAKPVKKAVAKVAAKPAKKKKK